MIETLFPKETDQKEVRQKLFQTLRRSYNHCVYDELKTQSSFQNWMASGDEDPSQTANTPPRHEISNECPICLGPSEEKNPLRKGSCGQCELHAKCEAEKWRHFIANHAVTPLQCSICRERLNLEDGISSDLLDEDEQERLKEIALQNYLKNGSGWEYCKTPDCPGIGHEGDAKQGDTLLSWENQCFICYEKFPRWRQNQKTRDLELRKSEEYIRRSLLFRNFTRCPKCKTLIEKNGGCGHMTCRCRYEFSWLTSLPWRWRWRI
jgi:ariadne-1